MRKFLLFSLLIVFILSISACQKEETEKVVARVNDDILTENELKSGFTKIQWSNLKQEEKEEFIQQWINLTLLSQEGEKRGISHEESIIQKIETARKKVISNALLAQEISEIKLNEDDLFDYYKLHKSKFQTDVEQYKMQRIYVSNKEKLDQVLSAMKEGLKFTEAAKEYSEEVLGRSGGYTEFLGTNDVEKEIWNTIKNLKKWYYASVNVNNSYYIVRWYEKKEVKETKKFREVKDDISKIVFKERKKQLYKQILNDLKKESNISISI